MNRRDLRKSQKRLGLLGGKDRHIKLLGPKYELSNLVATGESNPKCYARSLKSCRGPISKEHYISENVLKKMGPISSEGIPWLAHLKRDLSVNDLVANCLCSFHNSFLSPLDVLAGDAIESAMRFAKKKNERVIIYGPSFERWMLKVLLGLVGTKKLEDGKGSISIDDIPEKWVRILFGLEEFTDGKGMYSGGLIGDKMKSGLEMRTLLLNKELAGLRVNFGALDVYLTMNSKEKSFRRDHPEYQNILYHPNLYRVPNMRSSFGFRWSEQSNPSPTQTQANLTPEDSSSEEVQDGPRWSVGSNVHKPPRRSPRIQPRTQSKVRFLAEGYARRTIWSFVLFVTEIFVYYSIVLSHGVSPPVQEV